MSLTHIAYVIGTRPEAIRSARLLQLVAGRSDLRLTLINSGQHYDRNMLGAFLEELDVPAVSANLGLGPTDPAAQISAVTQGTAEILRDDPPDVLCVFGDTNSSLGGALAATKVGVPLVHIEAGCRSFDMQMPEEVNRRLIDHMSGLLLAVSDVGRDNLERESVRGQIEVVGDPQYDVFADHGSEVPREDPASPRGLVTLHRPSNVDDRTMLDIILGHLDRASSELGIRWTFPVHPRTRGSLPEMPGSIDVVEPLSYHDLLAVLASSRVCVTDSGGLQKEALWMKVPCVTVRDTSEWLETLYQGANVLAPPGSDISGAILNSLSQGADPDFSNPYGDGRASERILSAMGYWLDDGAAFSPIPEIAGLARGGRG